MACHNNRRTDIVTEYAYERKNNMKLSFTTMATPKQSGIEAIQMARQYGYAGVDLRVSDHMGELTLSSTPQQINDIKKAFLTEGIEPSGLLCYNDVGSDNPSSWKRMTESILRNLEIAARIEAPTVRIFGGNPEESTNPEDYCARTAQAIAEALMKDGSNITVLIQNHENNYLAKEAVSLIKRIGSDRFGLVFSPDHCIITGEPLSEVYPLIKPVTRQLYIADVIKIESKYKSILPEKGCVPLNEAYQFIGGDMFEGWITFKWEKIWFPELEEPEEALPYFIKHLDTIFTKGQNGHT